MSSRDAILNAIKQNRPQPVELPELKWQTPDEPDLLLQYRNSLEKNGGTCTVMDSIEEISHFIILRYPNVKNICSLLPEVQGNIDIKTVIDPHWLEDVDLAVVRGVLGVSENAAIWLPESMLGHRALPFITQHLIVVLEVHTIVPDMHEAYKKINVNESGYGVFIAGPSKTADIEQSLVIGAHGARSLEVILV